MAGRVIAEVTLLRCAFALFYLSVCLCQRDCTGVDCPQLDSCIEEVLESGACCASCLQKGCTCEGYQYYDCINAGFKNGKVPEGDSYFVDYGSTECSCPAGGGRISCHFISCPDIPPNCIEISEPADGCRQCERVGCVHDGQTYEAGHSFHIDHCRVCHCPNEGGKLMCYSVPDCDPQKVDKPMLAAPTEEDTSSSYPYRFDQQGHMDQISSLLHLPTNGNLPLFKSSPLDEDEPDDYDYDPTDSPDSYPQSHVFPTQSSSSTNKVISVSRGSDRPDRTPAHQSFDGRNKLELRERYGVHDHPSDREKVTESTLREEQSTVRPNMHRDTTTSWQSSQGLANAHSVTFSDPATQTGLENPLYVLKSSNSVIVPLHQRQGSEKHPEYHHMSSPSSINRQKSFQTKTHHENGADIVTPSGSNTSRINISHPVSDTDSQTNQQIQSDIVRLPLYTLRSPESPVYPQESSDGQKELQRTVAPDREEGVDEEEIEEEEEEEEILTFHTVTGPEGGDTLKSAQQERSHMVSESSNPTSSYKRTTPKPSTRSPRGPEYLTTPTVHFITTTTTQPPVRDTPDESEPSRKPGQKLFNLHSEEQEEVKEEAMEKTGERRDHPVRPDGEQCASR